MEHDTCFFFHNTYSGQERHGIREHRDVSSDYEHPYSACKGVKVSWNVIASVMNPNYDSVRKILSKTW